MSTVGLFLLALLFFVDEEGLLVPFFFEFQAGVFCLITGFKSIRNRLPLSSTRQSSHFFLCTFILISILYSNSG
ncbi:MAG: hypothetical protein C0615_04960 [Desulfuromonas sp.]|nr:MAG: hypothetical protein C0615_04960 [Desulfuromonas sp.]